MKDLKPILEKRFLEKNTNEWLSILEEIDVPCGLIHDYDSLFLDPQVIHNEMVKSLAHRDLGQVKTLGNPIKFGRTPVVESKASPVLGEDSKEVLSVLGYNGDEIADFKERGVI